MNKKQSLIVNTLYTAGVSLIALATAVPAFSQQTGSGPTRASSSFEEIIVTAQRREQSLQDVPISITAMTGEQVRELNVTRAVDLSSFTPGLFAAGSRGDANPIFAIRGVGLNDTFSNNNPTVGVYVDDVVLPLTPMLGFAMYDIERIEVLKGPQGTLYGRNTTGGAINFISKRPTQELDAYIQGSYGRYGRLDLEGAVGGGLSDTFAVRVSGKTTQQSGGWQTNAVTGEKIGDKDVKAMRVQALWTPSDNLEILLKGSLHKERSDNQLREHVGYRSPLGGDCQGFLNGVRDEGNCVNSLGYFDPTEDRRVVEASEVYGHESVITSKDIMLNINWDLGGVALTSITGYTDFSRNLGDEADGSPLVLIDSRYIDDIESFSQELRLASSGDGPLTWVVGAYYSWDQLYSDIDQALDDHFFRTRVSIDALQTTESYALFGQAEWEVSDRIRLIGGLRYTNEKKDFVYDSFDTNPFGTSAGLPTPVAGVVDRIKEDNISGKIGLDFKINDDVMLYASASKGFKSGGFKSAIAFNPAELNPFMGEDLYSYEVGMKSSLLDGRLLFNTAFYYLDYKDFQAFVTEIHSGINVIVLNNAGDARVYGLEAEVTARPTDRLLVRLAANVMDTKITKINPAVQAAYLGNRMANSPNFMLNAIARYDLPTESMGFGTYIMLDGSYRTKTYFSVNNRGQSSQDAYFLMNGRIAFTSPDERWEFAVWGRNLTNKLYVTNAYDNYGGIFPSQNFLGDPRTYGVSLAFRY